MSFSTVNKNCADLFKNGARKDGIYTISPDMKNSIKVKCDMTTDGGGWTVFQSRLDGSVDFFRDWNDYKNGFGEAEGEHWLGLDNIYRLCAISENVLTIDLEDFDGENRYAQYGIFEIGPEDQNYRLHVKNYLAGTLKVSLFLGSYINFINNVCMSSKFAFLR